MEHQGQHGHATNQASEYGNPVATGHGATSVGAAAGEQVHHPNPMRDDHKTDGLLRRSGSSSSSSSVGVRVLFRRRPSHLDLLWWSRTN